MYLNHPEDLGFSSQRLKRIEDRMSHYVESGKLAGIVTLVACQGEVVHLGSYGWQDIKAKTPMSSDTIFRIYSMTKPITCSALMMLYEQGLFRLRDVIEEFIPEFKEFKVLNHDGTYSPMERSITIHNLLTHMAGLVYAEEGDTQVHDIYSGLDLWDPAITNEELVRRISKVPLVVQPGTLWTYGVATDVIGRLVEVLSGVSLSEYFSKYIFEPLGMVDTSFSVSKDKSHRFAELYSHDAQGELTAYVPSEGGEYFDVQLHSGGGGLVSTALDYFRFAQLFLNGGAFDDVWILGPRTIELMTSNQVPVGAILIEDQMGAGSYGWAGAAETDFWIDPIEKIVGIMLTQYMPKDTYPVAMDFRTLVYQALID
jgi:CubicO group peptidase (beta-lactamase class C family)